METEKTLLQNVSENASYVIGILAIIAAIFLLAVVFELVVRKKNGDKGRVFGTRKIVMCGMFAALSGVIMLLEIPMPFAPSFYKLDFSELPVLVGGFAYGPAAAVVMEFLKVVIKLVLKNTSTAFVGEFANFAVGCSLVLPASMIYSMKKSKKTAVVSLICGTLIMTVFGTAFNAIYLLPAFAALYGMPLDVILGMGAEVNSLAGNGIVSFVIACVAPLNLIKGAADSVICLAVYKRLSPIFKSASERVPEATAREVG
ncbi:MAG: ECF transporter S component [Lachnospiraceae bacterium]|nr:ECF transporter S component [Lachnospiraceae bacterium]